MAKRGFLSEAELYEFAAKYGFYEEEPDISSFDIDASVRSIKERLARESKAPYTLYGYARMEVERLIGDNLPMGSGSELCRAIYKKMFEDDELLFIFTDRGGVIEKSVSEYSEYNLIKDEWHKDKDIIKRLCKVNVENLLMADAGLLKDVDFVCEVVFPQEGYSKEEISKRAAGYLSRTLNKSVWGFETVAMEDKFIDNVIQNNADNFGFYYLYSFKYGGKENLQKIVQRAFECRDRMTDRANIYYSNIVGKLRKNFEFLFGLDHQFPGILEDLPKKEYFDYCSAHGLKIDADKYDLSKAERKFVSLYNSSLDARADQEESDKKAETEQE